MQPFQVRFSAPKVGYRGWHEAALEAISVYNPGCPTTRNYMYTGNPGAYPCRIVACCSYRLLSAQE